MTCYCCLSVPSSSVPCTTCPFTFPCSSHISLSIPLSTDSFDILARWRLQEQGSHLGMFESLLSQRVLGLALYYHAVGGDGSVAPSQQSIKSSIGQGSWLKPPGKQPCGLLLLQAMPLDGEKVMGTFWTG